MEETTYFDTTYFDPVPWQLVPGRTAHVVIDLQNDFLHPDGWYATHGIDVTHMQRVIEPTRRLNEACRRSAVPIIWTRHGTYGVEDGGPFMRKRVLLLEGGLRKNTWGYEILDELGPHPEDRFVEKTRLSAFFKTDLEELLRELGVETVLLTGVLTNQCVGATCKDALYRDFMPIVVEDCVGTATPHLHDPAIEMIRVGWGQVNTLAATLDELAGFPQATLEEITVGTIGAQFLPESFDDCIASVRAAEEAGYSHAWFIDSQILWQDCFVYMTHALAQTNRITVGTAVTNPYTRHVTTTASVFATLAELHPGRLTLGIGRGDSAVRTMGLDPVRTSFLAESVPRLRELMAGRHVTINGADVHLRWVHGDPAIPIMMPATGPRNLRLAGSLADRVMLYVGINEESLSWALGHVRAGAEQAGRDPDSIAVSVLTAMWVSDDQQEAWDRCRWAPAACANHIADTVKRNPSHGMPEPMVRLPRSREEYDYYAGHLSSEAEHTAYLTGELIDDFALAGDADKVREKVLRLFALGVDEISCAYLNGAFEQMKTVGKEIIPVAGAAA